MTHKSKMNLTTDLDREEELQSKDELEVTKICSKYIKQKNDERDQIWKKICKNIPF